MQIIQKHDCVLDISQYAMRLDHLARTALYEEVSLEQKPGLVCPTTQGSHTDMDFPLFQRSIDALQGYFQSQCLNGYQHVAFDNIRQCGIQAEQKMMDATAQINTHKGAIFNLGFASAAVGKCFAQDIALNAISISRMIQQTWQEELLHHLERNPNSHGQRMRSQYGITGAIEEVASGFKTVLDVAVPHYLEIYAKTEDKKRASLQALFALMSHLQDTNIVWRGGLSALYIVQDMAKQFLVRGGVLQVDWMQEVKRIEDYFVQHHLSPGGSADLLGVTLFMLKVEHEFRNII
ncbi:triphosphoribosyl-dephospho-CoA synthase MdcB [Acinetobacter sp. PK01]|jgi:triphosphoribosyl-dephospho-CoA synthase|uniref:triphosphoribosyl-dephospho-CoA synthase MdcB n=1 Tax=Acinetobacter sp. PK01 TaxID=2930198 RepID=UPI001FB79BCE|nr:triphosphoribosyl-dephospho-CoA synthase MdcB [Acinetobacter sp. PK01]UOG18914.1 triphosphoribosyl-dephospho-CoA synthase MdcB [Acinetobacter sp. PK01]